MENRFLSLLALPGVPLHKAREAGGVVIYFFSFSLEEALVLFG